jgi:hypothetical protein
MKTWMFSVHSDMTISNAVRTRDSITPPGEGRTQADSSDQERMSIFIPSVELKGSRREKLETLDTLIRYLEQLRRSLAGEASAPWAAYESPSPHVADPSWTWLAMGIAVSAAFLLMALAARSCS